MSIASRLQALRAGFRRFRNQLRASSLFGRAYNLRAQGRLEEALVACTQALELAGPVGAGIASSNLGSLVVGAIAFDEIASRLGRPRLALEPLSNALFALREFMRDNPRSRSNDLFVRYEQQITERLGELRSAT